MSKPNFFSGAGGLPCTPELVVLFQRLIDVSTVFFTSAGQHLSTTTDLQRIVFISARYVFGISLIILQTDIVFPPLSLPVSRLHLPPYCLHGYRAAHHYRFKQACFIQIFLYLMAEALLSQLTGLSSMFFAKWLAISARSGEYDHQPRRLALSWRTCASGRLSARRIRSVMRSNQLSCVHSHPDRVCSS